MSDADKRRAQRLRAAAWIVVAVGVMPAATALGAGGDVAKGREKAILCQNCHGMDGLAKLPEASNLAGQTEVYLVKALTDFKTGARKHETMSIVAGTLTDDDVRNLAAYYSAIEISVKPPAAK